MKPKALLLLASLAASAVAAKTVAASTNEEGLPGVLLVPRPFIAPGPPVLLRLTDDGAEQRRRSDNRQKQGRSRPKESKPASAALATVKAQDKCADMNHDPRRARAEQLL
ncbi:hypothetical protein [Paraburkholderia sp. BL27I4N3]|uniref:hypothetical protein n=1 Tax=Paraburkholderia sp. BL27I4N3 TaxID=1938805 RepID=UPI0011C0565C|nr:hypothetical protein [Paraburkholderia sp. BL27I4N3]